MGKRKVHEVDFKANAVCPGCCFWEGTLMGKRKVHEVDFKANAVCPGCCFWQGAA